MSAITRTSQKVFHRYLFAGMNETLTLLKRLPDQQSGTVTSYLLFDCRRSVIHKAGEPIQGDMSSRHYTVWHIPIIEMERIGVSYIGPLDRIVNFEGTWQPESGQDISTKLIAQHIDVACLMVAPSPENS